MSKLGNDLIASMKVALAHARGEPVNVRVHKVWIDVPNVKAIRTAARLSQDEFAQTFAVPVGTVRGWEQGRRRPEGPALTLLKVIEKEPAAVMRALGVRKAARKAPVPAAKRGAAPTGRPTYGAAAGSRVSKVRG